VFTGIVEEVGTLVVRDDAADSAVLRIRAQRVLEGVALGDSIAVNGVCLTVTEVTPDGVWSTDVMAETLRRSSLGDAGSGDRVNLERAVTPHTRLGGHLMQGHVDGVAASSPALPVTPGRSCASPCHPSSPATSWRRAPSPSTASR
jgi:riboflavin synthase